MLTSSADAGSYCQETEDAVRRFQQVRGLHATGNCDEHTWKALVEATWKLGNRLLVLTSPNIRGDDVADLQSRLGVLGFDCGRPDGIFGPLTAHALGDFQSNCGLVADAVCGTDTIRVLQRVSSQTGTGPGVAVVRERERLRETPTSVSSLRVVVGQFGGLGSVVRAVTQEIRACGAHVMSLDEPDAGAQALAANHFAADLYLGFESAQASMCVVHFYGVPTFESMGGRALAEAFTTALAGVDLDIGEPCGMRLPVLRETKMPAVLCTLAPVRRAVDVAPQIAAATLRALELWTTTFNVAV